MVRHVFGGWWADDMGDGSQLTVIDGVSVRGALFFVRILASFGRGSVFL